MKLTRHDWAATLTNHTTDKTQDFDILGIAREPIVGLRFGDGVWHWYRMRYNSNYAYKFNRACISTAGSGVSLVEQLALIWKGNASGLRSVLEKFLRYKETSYPFCDWFDFEAEYGL